MDPANRVDDRLDLCIRDGRISLFDPVSPGGNLRPAIRRQGAAGGSRPHRSAHARL